MAIGKIPAGKPPTEGDDDLIKISAYLPRKTYREFRIKLLRQSVRANVSRWINAQVDQFLERP
jgi:hypothetical protein